MFYNPAIPKIIIIGYTVPKIWHVTDVTGLFQKKSKQGG